MKVSSLSPLECIIEIFQLEDVMQTYCILLESQFQNILMVDCYRLFEKELAFVKILGNIYKPIQCTLGHLILFEGYSKSLSDLA